LSKSIVEKKAFIKGLNSPLQNGPFDTREKKHDLCYRAARFNEKGCLPVWGGDALSFIYVKRPS
jgi:hypothetical protein